MPDAALLIDWENFYAGREENAGERFDIAEDLVDLSDLALQIVRDRNRDMRLAVRRAYADFNARRRNREAPGQGSALFLHRTPRQLMDHGVEPVQVFRFPGGSAKNAADMRLAVDALRLMADGRSLEMFVIVTGDADFIPLAIDLRRMGAYVALIGIADHTKQVFQRYVDRFDLFEDLVAAQRLSENDDGPLQAVREALHAVLAERPRVVFSAVRPLINEHLSQPFDPGRFGADNMGDFLRRNAADLGLNVQRGEHDWELTGPATSNATPAATPADRQPPAPSAAFYARVLRSEWPKLFVLPDIEMHTVLALLVDALRDSVGQSGATSPEALLEQMAEAAEMRGMEDSDRKVKAFLFQCLCAGVLRDASSGESVTDASPERWLQPVTPVHAEAGAFVAALQRYVVETLASRLRRHGVALEAQALAELFRGASPSEDDVARAQVYMSR